MAPKNPDARCKARAKSGKRCGAAATSGGLCFFHANPNKASELGRIGGRSNRHTADESLDPLPTLDSALVVRNTLNRLISEVYARKLDPKIASGLAPLMNLQLRAIETTNLEQRMAELERSVAELAAPRNSGAAESAGVSFRQPSFGKKPAEALGGEPIDTSRRDGRDQVRRDPESQASD